VVDCTVHDQQQRLPLYSGAISQATFIRQAETCDCQALVLMRCLLGLFSMALFSMFADAPLISSTAAAAV